MFVGGREAFTRGEYDAMIDKGWPLGMVHVDRALQRIINAEYKRIEDEDRFNDFGEDAGWKWRRKLRRAGIKVVRRDLFTSACQSYEPEDKNFIMEILMNETWVHAECPHGIYEDCLIMTQKKAKEIISKMRIDP